MQVVEKIKSLIDGEIPKSLRLELAEARGKVLIELLNSRRQYLYPKDPQFTELDRRTMMEANTAQLEADYQLLTDLTRIIEGSPSGNPAESPEIH